LADRALSDGKWSRKRSSPASSRVLAERRCTTDGKRMCGRRWWWWRASASTWANGRFVESTDTFGNELLPLSVLQHATLTFDQYYAPPDASGDYPIGDQALAAGAVPGQDAYRVAPELPSKSVPWWFVRVGGLVISLYPIVPGLLNVPVFFVASLLHVELQANVVPLTHVTTSVMAALTVLAMYVCWMLLGGRQRTAIFLTIAFACGTAVWSANSRSLYQHGVATLFLTLALAALLSRRPRLIAVSAGLLGRWSSSPDRRTQSSSLRWVRTSCATNAARSQASPPWAPCRSCSWPGTRGRSGARHWRSARARAWLASRPPSRSWPPRAC